MIIPNKVYRAVIIGLSDTTDGKYKIYIPSLMSHDPTFKSCIAKNKASTYGKWMDPTTKEVKSIGTYIPLQTGMPVNVVFETDHYTSAQIIGLVFDEIPLNKDDQENFYLFGKTKNGTQIYVDESRNITHVMHNKGMTNLMMFDDKISLSVNEVSNAGINNFSNIELGAESIVLKVGETSFVLDESGIQMATKDNRWEFGSKEINFKTSKFTVEANSYEVQADKVYINGLEEAHIKSTVTRVTGGQQLALNGNVVNVESNINTTIQSNGSVYVKSLLNCVISCPVNMHIYTEGLMTISGTQTLLDGNSTIVNGQMLTLNGGTVALDGTFLTNFGVATGIANSSKAMAIGANLSFRAIDIAYATAFHFGDGGSGMVCNVMTETLPGVAQGVPNPTIIPNITPRFDYINTTVKYMTTNTNIGNMGTYDNMQALGGNYLPVVHMKK